jgi:hypothetical protein
LRGSIRNFSLENLRRRGVWLLDASPVALYGMDKKPSRGTIEKTLHASWHVYTAPLLRASDAKHIIVIGKSVFDALESRLRHMFGEDLSWIYQPQARRPREDHEESFKRLYGICSEHA